MKQVNFELSAFDKVNGQIIAQVYDKVDAKVWLHLNNHVRGRAKWQTWEWTWEQSIGWGWERL